MIRGHRCYSDRGLCLPITIFVHLSAQKRRCPIRSYVHLGSRESPGRTSGVPGVDQRMLCDAMLDLR